MRGDPDESRAHPDELARRQGAQSRAGARPDRAGGRRGAPDRGAARDVDRARATTTPRSAPPPSRCPAAKPIACSRRSPRAPHRPARRLDHRADGDAIYNTTVVFDRDGRELARYRKLHLFDITTPMARSSASLRPSPAARASSPTMRSAPGSGCRSATTCAFRSSTSSSPEGAKVILVPATFTPADRQGPLGGAAARPGDRDPDLRAGAGAMGPLRRQRACSTATP